MDAKAQWRFGDNSVCHSSQPTMPLAKPSRAAIGSAGRVGGDRHRDLGRRRHRASAGGRWLENVKRHERERTQGGRQREDRAGAGSQARTHGQRRTRARQVLRHRRYAASVGEHFRLGHLCRANATDEPPAAICMVAPSRLGKFTTEFPSLGNLGSSTDRVRLMTWDLGAVKASNSLSVVRHRWTGRLADTSGTMRTNDWRRFAPARRAVSPAIPPRCVSATAHMQPYKRNWVFTQVIDYQVFMRHIPFFYESRCSGTARFATAGCTRTRSGSRCCRASPTC